VSPTRSKVKELFFFFRAWLTYKCIRLCCQLNHSVRSVGVDSIHTHKHAHTHDTLQTTHTHMYTHYTLHIHAIYKFWPKKKNKAMYTKSVYTKAVNNNTRQSHVTWSRSYAAGYRKCPISISVIRFLKLLKNTDYRLRHSWLLEQAHSVVELCTLQLC